MGLFSFLRDAGKKLFNRDETSGMSAEEKARHMEKKLIDEFYDHKLPIDEFSVKVDGDKATVKGVAESQADKEKAILILGNVEGIGSVEDLIEVHDDGEIAEFYTVKSGDSLSKISKKFYGNAMKYNAIFEANQPMLKDVNLIYPGQVLRIPKL